MYSNHAPRFARTPRRRSVPASASPETVAAFTAAHPDVVEWLERKKFCFDFAGSLHGALNRYGRLSPAQIDAARRCIVRDAQYEQARRERDVNAPEASITAIETAFARALAAGVTNPKLSFAEFRFGLGRDRTTIWVNDRETRACLGRVVGGKFLRAFRCDEEMQERILAVCADPHNAALAYGAQFGVCSACNRTLTDPKSVAANIGPVCAEMYGWRS